jgi:hypothetical protein
LLDDLLRRDLVDLAVSGNDCLDVITDEDLGVLAPRNLVILNAPLLRDLFECVIRSRRFTA